MEIVGFKLKIFQNYLFVEKPTNSLTAYSEKLTLSDFSDLFMDVKFSAKLFDILNKITTTNTL